MVHSHISVIPLGFEGAGSNDARMEGLLTTEFADNTIRIDFNFSFFFHPRAIQKARVQALTAVVPLRWYPLHR